MSDAAIRVRGLRKAYGAVQAVRGLDLDVARGEVFGLLGPNGAGKTTTVEVLEGYRDRDAGEVDVLGFDPGRADRDFRERIGIVLQHSELPPNLTVREVHRLFAGYYTAPRDVDEVVELVGLGEKADARVKTLSGGQRRRLDLGVALVGDPELVFLDEPTVGVDPQSRNHVHELVANLRAKGTTLVYTTHQLGEVERLCDRIVILDRGHAIASGSLADLQSRVPARGGRRLALSSADRAEEARALLMAHGIEARVESELPGLEEVFLALTGHALRDGGAA